MWKIGRIWLCSLWRLLVPRCCVVCGNTLQEGEEVVCLRCNMDLPRTGYHLKPDNPVERALWAKMPLVRASSYVYYRRGGSYASVLHLLKYKGRKDIALSLGKQAAAELMPSGFFEGVDVIVPVPLHPRKQRSRGYNQSQWLARGLSAVTGIPVDGKSVTRDKDTDTQTHKSVMERQDNVAGIFSLHAPEAFKGKHVLIVDDVFTTGATVTACADALDGVEGVQVSVLTLAVAGS